MFTYHWLLRSFDTGWYWLQQQQISGTSCSGPDLEGIFAVGIGLELYTVCDSLILYSNISWYYFVKNFLEALSADGPMHCNFKLQDVGRGPGCFPRHPHTESTLTTLAPLNDDYNPDLSPSMKSLLLLMQLRSVEPLSPFWVFFSQQSVLTDVLKAWSSEQFSTLSRDISSLNLFQLQRLAKLDAVMRCHQSLSTSMTWLSYIQQPTSTVSSRHCNGLQDGRTCPSTTHAVVCAHYFCSGKSYCTWNICPCSYWLNLRFILGDPSGR